MNEMIKLVWSSTFGTAFAHVLAAHAGVAAFDIDASARDAAVEVADRAVAAFRIVCQLEEAGMYEDAVDAAGEVP